MPPISRTCVRMRFNLIFTRSYPANKEKLIISSRPGLEVVFIYGSNEATNKVTVIDEAGTGR